MICKIVTYGVHENGTSPQGGFKATDTGYETVVPHTDLFIQANSFKLTKLRFLNESNFHEFTGTRCIGEYTFIGELEDKVFEAVLIEYEPDMTIIAVNSYVYLMNDNGKTIDSKHCDPAVWSDLPVNNRVSTGSNCTV